MDVGLESAGRRPVVAHITDDAWVKPRRVLFVLDAAVVALVLAITWLALSQGWYRAVPAGTAAARGHYQLLALICGVTLFALSWKGQYAPRRRLSRIDDAMGLGRAMGIAVVVALAAAFLSKGLGAGFTNYSRRLVLLDVAGLFALMVAMRLVICAWQQRLFRRGEGVRRLVVAGAGAESALFQRFLADRPWLGYRCSTVVAVLDHATEAQREGGLAGAPPTGTYAELPQVMRQAEASEVVLALDDDEQDAFPAVVSLLVEEGIPFRVMPSLFQPGYRHAQRLGVDELATVGLNERAAAEVQRAVKRIVDVFGAILALLLLAPIFLALALLIRLDSRGPVFYAQARVGTHGRRFRLLKFRTMHFGADDGVECLLPLNDGEECLFKIKADPRITRVGRWLRRWSIDELPQFINVLRSDMSIVGPRPPLPREVDRYGEADLVRLTGKPGITGLWQVSGRSDLPFEKMVDLDRYYLQNWSLALDLSIILRTPLVMLSRKGAY